MLIEAANQSFILNPTKLFSLLYGGKVLIQFFPPILLSPQLYEIHWSTISKSKQEPDQFDVNKVYVLGDFY